MQEIGHRAVASRRAAVWRSAFCFFYMSTPVVVYSPLRFAAVVIDMMIISLIL